MLQPPVPFPPRPLDAHKGSVGRVLVVAGSRGMAGAACLTAQAALRTGAGLVTLACPEGLLDVVQIKATCVIAKPLPQTASGALSSAAAEPLLELLHDKDALALGPGLGQDPETQALVRAVLAHAEVPTLVLDADGLNAFAGCAERLAHLAGRAVLTPHPGEFARLDPGGDGARGPRLRAFVERVGVCTLLKGQRTLIDDGARSAENPTGNPGMASAGMGDVLTGVIAALAAAGLAPFEAATLGAWLHGRAGDLAAEVLGWAGLTAVDLLAALPRAILPLESRSS